MPNAPSGSTTHTPYPSLPNTPYLPPLERYRPLLGEEWDAFCESLHHPLPQCVWTNTARISSEELASWLDRCGLLEHAQKLSWTEDAWKIPANLDVALGTLMPFLAGLYHIQEEVSLIPGWMLAPRAGERVLDTCAAPGGKSAQLAIMMQNQGTVVANDRSHGRLRALRSIIDRLGLLNVSMSHYNAANFPRDIGTFDRVLVDVPCSCEGTSRKNRRVLRSLEGFDYENQSRLQKAILVRALEQLRPGGLLAYSTCTYAPEENERVVHAALEEVGRERYALQEAPPLEGFTTSPGLTSWQEERYGDDLTRCVRIWPHQNDTGGFFVALISRQA